MTSRTATAPLDRIKVYLIAQTTSDASATSFIRQGRFLKASAAGSTSFFKACQSIWNVGGVSSLWAGNGLNIVKMLPEGAIKFGSYEVSTSHCKAIGIRD